MNEKIKHALEVCERVMNHACKVGDSEWSVYSGFREAREAIKAAQHSVQRTVDQPCKKHNMEFCSECFPVVVVDFTRR